MSWLVRRLSEETTIVSVIDGEEMAGSIRLENNSKHTRGGMLDMTMRQQRRTIRDRFSGRVKR